MLKKLKSKKGSASIEYVLIIVLVVLVVIFAVAKLGSSMKTTIDNSTDSISKQSDCALAGGTYYGTKTDVTYDGVTYTTSDTTFNKDNKPVCVIRNTASIDYNDTTRAWTGFTALPEKGE